MLQAGRGFLISSVRFTSLMSRMLSLSREYRVELDPCFASVRKRKL